jgi:hypothetical protein
MTTARTWDHEQSTVDGVELEWSNMIEDTGDGRVYLIYFPFRSELTGIYYDYQVTAYANTPYEGVVGPFKTIAEAKEHMK